MEFDRRVEGAPEKARRDALAVRLDHPHSA